jgi:penicillin amidase
MVDWLTLWDYQNSADSPQAAFFSILWRELMLTALEELPLYESSHSTYLLLSILRSENHPLWKNEALGLADRDAVITHALRQAIPQAEALLGADRSVWRWDDLHVAPFHSEILRHIPAANTPENAAIFNRQIGVGGLGEAPNSTTWEITSGNFEVTQIPSMRLLIDFSDFDQTRAVLPLGQSGQPDSPHFADQMELWAQGEYRVQVFWRQAVEANTVKIWRLVGE